jgi:hypothetical protein
MHSIAVILAALTVIAAIAQPEALRGDLALSVALWAVAGLAALELARSIGVIRGGGPPRPPPV